MAENTKLFTPLKVGSTTLEHRIVMAPLTRFRGTDDHVPTDIMARYYQQRSVVPGTLVISEATFISKQGGGYANVPGLYTDAQLEGWKKVTDAVHAKGSKIFAQLWHLGRAAAAGEASGNPPKDDSFDWEKDFVSASAVPITEAEPVPRALTEEEIQTTIADYARAAKNAVEKGGFDGVEIHGAHGYLIDQFTQDTSNKRTDSWGGSIENRARFAVEVAKAVVAAVGKEKVGIRLSPWSTFQGMRMKDPIPQFSYLIDRLTELDLSFLHLVEPRVHGVVDMEPANETLDFALQAWGREKPIFIAGGYTTELAVEAVEKKYKDYADQLAIVFGRRFISNPDLVFKVQKGIPFAEYDRATFYIHQKKGDKVEPGYIDYPYSEEFIKQFGEPALDY
ncbi:flavin oxidoreductase nadh oxidase family protein [Diaporthe amygdali]|uniref:flavin oxidoreductase nadh oxidase family protein n=1 Tax=Phomopsis amygdali TaxID=1214568 RepID=UPI0022FF38AD|nr:flavin oxidoreductase nadh oxidase family protein [Diaporthe amygdali]KAJ0108185.1 flavin oxidoreductase nadh oxidase family protein [Diaporthe amygdali]